LSSILDIDLDYFAILDNPINRLNDLLNWGNRPVEIVTEKHHRILKEWKKFIKKGIISLPQYILHVDEHHDMMDERKTPNIANFLYHAMIQYPDCQVYWLVEEPIDSPEMWLSDDVWDMLAHRFTQGSKIPSSYPKPDFVSVCTSPEFLSTDLRCSLLENIELWNKSCGLKIH